MRNERDLTGEQMLYIGLGLAVAAWVLFHLDVVWAKASEWLVKYHVLTTENLVISLPGGVGLDGMRIGLAVAVLLVGGGLRYLSVRRRVAAAIETAARTNGSRGA
jgi:hypothetical protein